MDILLRKISARVNIFKANKTHHAWRILSIFAIHIISSWSYIETFLVKAIVCSVEINQVFEKIHSLIFPIIFSQNFLS